MYKQWKTHMIKCYRVCDLLSVYKCRSFFIYRSYTDVTGIIQKWAVREQQIMCEFDWLVEPRKEVAWLIFECSVKNGFTSYKDFYVENVIEVKSRGSMNMKISIWWSILICKPWLVGEGGLNTFIMVSYPVIFLQTKFKPHSNISRKPSCRGLTVGKSESTTVCRCTIPNMLIVQQPHNTHNQ